MKLRWTLNAGDDPRRIRRYISRDNPDAAKRWVQRLRERAGKPASMPHAGRVVPEFDRDDISEVIVGSYRIVYRVRATEVLVLTVFEGDKLLGEPPRP